MHIGAGNIDTLWNEDFSTKGKGRLRTHFITKRLRLQGWLLIDRLGKKQVSVVRINECSYQAGVELGENVRVFSKDKENCP